LTHFFIGSIKELDRLDRNRLSQVANLVVLIQIQD